MAQFIALILYLSEPLIPIWWAMFGLLFAHPTMGWLMANFKIFHSKLKFPDKLVFDIGSQNIAGYSCVLIIESIIVNYVFFVVGLLYLFQITARNHYFKFFID